MFLSQLISLIPPTLLWMHQHQWNSIFGIHKEPDDLFWGGKYKLMVGKDSKSLKLNINCILPPLGRDQIIFVDRTLFYKRKEKKKMNREPLRKLHCLMLDGSMYKRNQSKKAFKFHFGFQVRLIHFSNSCISGILHRKEKKCWWNRKKKSM